MTRPASSKMIFLTLLLCVLAPWARAQAPISNLVVTLGTTIQDNSGNNWSYVVIGSAEFELLIGKQFSVYVKAGYTTNAGTFSFRTNIYQQLNVNSINALLNQSLALGEDFSTLTTAFDTFFGSSIQGFTNAALIPGITNATLPQQVLLVFQCAATNAAAAQIVNMLAHMHPGLLLCEGQGFAEIITGVTTYEVRDQAAQVVGRVTIVPGSPVQLPAPGMPFQVTTNDATDNLRIRLRWGTSDAFRRLSLLSFGFDVWRIPASNAVAMGFTTTPPTTSQLLGPAFTKANYAPVMAIKDYTTNSGLGGANDPTDTTTYFYSDNNGRPLGDTPQFTNGVIPPMYSAYLQPQFADGAQFYYFITARDLLGRDGPASPAVWLRPAAAIRRHN